MDNITKDGKYISDKVNKDLEKAFDSGFNVMLSGVHGTSKTSRVLQVAREKGVVLKYYSCSTLDPFTDLVGVPTPRKYCTQDKVWFATEKEACPHCSQELYGVDSPVIESLKLVRPTEIDEAELIFFDELNRADPKVVNAVMEIIQFGSINGDKIRNLVACWAAINPPNHEADYEVEELDPAIIDRFDIFIDIKPTPSAKYLATRYAIEHANQFAEALVHWWEGHHKIKDKIDFKKNYISPRRLEKMGYVYLEMGNAKSAVPSWVTAEHHKLNMMLGRAVKGEEFREDVLRGMGSSTKPNVEIWPKEVWEAHSEQFLQLQNPPTVADIRTNISTYKQAFATINSLKSFGDNELNYINAIVGVITRSNKDIILRDFLELFEQAPEHGEKIANAIIGNLNDDRMEVVAAQAGTFTGKDYNNNMALLDTLKNY